MKRYTSYLVLLVSLLLFVSAHAVTHYVDINSTNPVPPYTNWASAATSIQEGLDSATSNDPVLVADGLYNENISLKSGVVLQGAGADATVIEGAGGSVVMATNLDAVATISGFTITGGSGYDIGYGGGIYCENSLLVISYNIIKENHAAWRGGGVYCENSVPIIANNKIESNSTSVPTKPWGSRDSGGGVYTRGCSPIITNNVIANNLGVLDGGGICSVNDTAPLISDNRIEGNVCAYNTGGIACNSGSSAIIGNLIENNFGAYTGGVSSYGIDSIVVNNIIAKNRGIGISFADSLVVNNVIIHNDGIGVEGWSQADVVANCIIWGNWDDLDGCSAIYSCIEDGDPGEGNISSAPFFVYEENENYRLLSGSPCVDAGTNGYALTSMDADGNPRIVNGTVDMGPYEFQAGGSALNLHIQAILEKSPDLKTWTNSGMSIDWFVPADSINEFYRVWLNL